MPVRLPFLAEQYRLFAARVYGRCMVMCAGDTAAARDITHDVFVRLIEKGPAKRTPNAVASWLLTVADRLCIDRLRRERSVWGRVKAALVSLGAGAQESQESPEPAVSPGETVLARLRDALCTLPRREHEVIVKKYIEGRKQTEIAAQMGCSEGYVSKLLGRAVARLQGLGWEEADRD